MIEAGKTYVDEHNSRRIVTAVTADSVSYRLPISGRGPFTVPLAEFEAWSVGEYVDPFA